VKNEYPEGEDKDLHDECTTCHCDPKVNFSEGEIEVKHNHIDIVDLLKDAEVFLRKK
jgi:hypothetical protein